MTNPKRRSILLKSAVAAAAIAVTACGSSGGDSSTPTSPSPSGFVITITRQNGAQSFSPNPATAGGSPVVFRNADSIVHRVMLNDGSIDTGDIAPGATSRTLQMPATGTNYHCTVHPDMIGAVAAASGAPPPVCEGIYCD